MMRRRFLTTPLTIGHGLVLLVAGVLVATGSFAIGATSGSTTPVLRACVTNAGPSAGSMKLIGARQRCARGTRLVTWNQRGVAGAAGAPGPAGANGTNGTDGTDGAPGTNGTDGAPGANGTAVAFARISSTGVATNVKGISPTDVVKAGAGVYCFDLPFTPLNAVATSNPTKGVWTAIAIPALADCNASGKTDMSLKTGLVTAGQTSSDNGFYVLIN